MFFECVGLCIMCGVLYNVDVPSPAVGGPLKSYLFHVCVQFARQKKKPNASVCTGTTRNYFFFFAYTQELSIKDLW